VSRLLSFFSLRFSDLFRAVTASAYGEDAPLISKFRVSEVAIENLKKCNISRLFPIQATTFDYIYDGEDVIGRARTGEGKTLSFVLPVIEKMRSIGDNQKTRGVFAFHDTPFP
jgi:superfamily II DNA/RNA helicase